MNKIFYLFILLSFLFCPAKTFGKSQKYVVLPPGFENSKVIVADSPEYKKLLSEHKELQEQNIKETKDFDNLKKQTDDLLRQKVAENNKLKQELASEKAKSSKFGFLSKIFGFTSLLFPLGGIALIVLCIFNPGVIPVVIDFFVGIIHIIVNWIAFIFKGFKDVADKIASYKTKKPNTDTNPDITTENVNTENKDKTQ